MLFSQSSAVYFNNTLQYAINDLSRIGYQGIEIWGGRPHMFRNDLDSEEVEIKNLLKEKDIKVCNFIPAQFRYPSLLCSPNEHVRKDSVEYIKSAIDNAVKIGSPSLSLCPGMAPFDSDIKFAWAQLIKSFIEIEEYCCDNVLKLLIEPAHRFESNLILTTEDCMRMLDELKSDRFGILLDTGHANVNNEDFNKIIQLCKGLPLHVHIDDNDGDWDSHMIPGKGSIDFECFFRALKDIGYSGFISAELGAHYNMNPSNACEETLGVLKKMIC